MISVVCCFNDNRIYSEMLKDSLEKQTCDYELIAIDNQNNEFSSMAEAYNSVSNDVNSDTLLFCHQDISFPNSETLSKIEEYILKNKDSIVGLCGITKEKKVYSNLKYKNTGDYITSNQIDDVLEVESLDECCFGMKKEMIDELGWFDKEVCDGWHLYAAELCIRTIKKNKKIIVIPTECFHREEASRGIRIDNSFINIFKKIRNKHRDVNPLYSVSLIANTRNPKFSLTMCRLKMKYRMNKNNEDYCWREQND